MPELYFTPYQEQVWLQRNGYNPEEYYIEASTGSVLPKHRAQPTLTPETSQQIPVNKPTTEDTTAPSVFGSFGRGAASGVIPSAGSVITGGRVASALTPLATELVPATRGLSLAIPPIAGIASGLLSSFGLNKLQDALLPESIKATLAQDVATNPKAFLAGQVTSALPLLKPSISNLGRAVGTTGQIAENVITGGARPVAGADLSNLINVGLGTGVGIGSATIPNLIQGQEINPLEVALAAGGGALFSEPTKIGQKLAKLTPTEPRINRRKELERIQGEAEGESLQDRYIRQLNAQVKAQFLEQEPKGLRAALIKAEQGTAPELLAAKKFDIAETDIRPRTFYSESKVNEKGETKYLIPFNRISKEDKSLFPSLVNEKGNLRAGVDEAMFREKLDQRLYGSEFQKYKDLLEEARIQREEVDIREQQERSIEAAQREQKVLQNITQASLEERAKPGIIKPIEPTKPGERAFTTEQLARKPVTTLRQKAYNKEANYQYWKQLWKKASVEGNEQARKDADRFLEKSFAERYTKEEIEGKPQPKFSEVEHLPSQLLKKPTVFEEGEQGIVQGENKQERLESVKRLEAEVPKEKLPLKAATFDYFKENFGPLRNIEVKEDGSLIHSITKQPVKGEAVLREGISKATAKINPLISTIDTLGHEPFHIFVKDLETSPHKIDRDIASGFYKAVEASSEFNKINQSRINRGLKPFDANEIGTEEFGIEFARRILNPNKMESTLKQAWRDLLGRIRIRWGKANVNDYTRLLTERFFRDPDYIERFTGKGITPKPELEKKQPKEESKEIYEPTSKPTDELTDNEKERLKESGLPSREEQIRTEQRNIEQRQEQKEKITKFYEGEEQGLKPKPFPEKVTEDITSKLGEASVKAASETVRQQNVEKQSATEINKIYENLANDLGQQLQKVNPKIKNLDVEFLKDEISSIANNNKDVENAYRRRLGDEYIDELKDRIDKELRPSFQKYQEEVRTTQESGKKTLLKAEELEAFERQDVSRHQEEEQGLKQGSFVQGANTARALDIFGAGMYDKKPSATIAKEAIQNASDSFEKGQIDKKIYVGKLNNEQVFFADNGKGMTPSEVITKFLPAFVSGKEGAESRGSFGLAKIALLGSPKDWEVRTTAKVGDKLLTTTISGNPETWKTFVSKGLQINFNPNEPGIYKFHGMEFNVEETSSNSPTGTLYKATVDEEYSAINTAKKMLADISNDFETSYKRFYKDNINLAEALSLKEQSFLSEYSQPKDLVSLESHNVAGAKIEVKSKSNKGTVIYNIPIFNRGLRQFELPFYQDARLPEGLSIEVKPTVGVEDSNYPYTTNRDNLKGEAKKKVEDIIKNLAEFTKNEQIKMFSNVQKNAKRIEGTQTKYIDLSNSVPEDVINEITNSKVLKELGKIIRPMIRNMLVYANKRIGGSKFANADFSGFASGGDFLGVRFGTKQEGSKGEIYFDPFLLTEKVNQVIQEGMYKAEEFPLAYSEAISGVSVHEIAHQISHTEGEAHARAMTDLAGVLQGIGYSYEKKITNKLKELGSVESRLELTKLNDKIKQYENKEIARSMVESGRSEQYEQRLATSNFRNRQETEFTEGRFNRIGEEGTTKFSETEQGLRTPKEILDKIKSIRTAPEFQKESVFKKGIKELISSRIPIIGSDIDKLEIRGGESGKLIAPALREYFAKNREFEGKYLNPVIEQLNKLNNDELDNLYATMLSEKKQQKSLRDSLPEKQRNVYDVLRRVIKQKQEDQIKANQPVQEITKEGKINYRLPRIDPFYIPEIVGSKQLDILLNAQGSKAFDNLRSDFIKFQKKSYNLNDEAAAKAFDDLIASYGGPVKGDTTHFGAVRRSEGVGLPESWLEGDLTLAMRRYWRRVAKDRAFYDTVENNDNLLHVIGHKRNAWGERIKPSDKDLISLSGNETLGNIMDIIQGRFIKTNPRLDAFGRIASNLVLGPITGITDLINAAPILAKFIPSVSNIPGFLKASLNLVDGIKAAKRQGIIRENITSIGDIVSPADEFVEGLRKTADLVSKANTREYLEKASRGLSQALSDYLIGVHLNLAKTGNKKSINLLEGLANQKDYTKLSKEQLASRLVELNQGTYDPRGLPSWAIDSQIAPFFRLAKWNIEQLNNLHKHVIRPALKGDITPLLMTIGGGLIGGYLAKEVRERLNQKKQAIPEWKEILESKEGLKGNIPDATYNLAAAISYSGVTGLLGDLTKAGFDVAFKNTPQGFSYPLVEIIGDGAVKINQAADAIVEGENPIKVMLKLSEDLAANHIQIGRIINNQIQSRVTDKEAFKDIESRRNLRTFKMISNQPYTAQGIQADFENPYLNLEQKSFKRRGLSELQEASKEAVSLTKKALKEKDFGRVQKKLSSLKRNTFQTIPSPTNDPIGFSNFIKYNTKVRGEADTRERLQRYFKQNLANQVKASFIP